MKWKTIQALIGLGLMSYTLYVGRIHFEIFLYGKPASGSILRFEETTLSFEHDPGRTTYQPIVQFVVDGKSYTFKNFMSTRDSGGVGTNVPVIYNSLNPSEAIVDQGYKNYIPWAPMFLMGFLAVLGAIDRRNGVSIVPKGPLTIEEAQRLALEGQWIAAIKVYRRVTGAGLKEAKEYIENYLKSQNPKG